MQLSVENFDRSRIVTLLFLSRIHPGVYNSLHIFQRVNNSLVCRRSFDVHDQERLILRICLGRFTTIFLACDLNVQIQNGLKTTQKPIRYKTVRHSIIMIEFLRTEFLFFFIVQNIVQTPRQHSRNECRQRVTTKPIREFKCNPARTNRFPAKYPMTIHGDRQRRRTSATGKNRSVLEKRKFSVRYNTTLLVWYEIGE